MSITFGSWAASHNMSPDNAPAQSFSQPQQPIAKPQGPGGILGFLQGVGQSIGSDFARTGQGVANVIHEMTGGAQQERDQQLQSQQNDVNTIKSLGQQLRAAKTDQDRQRIQGALSKIVQTGDTQDQAFQQHQNNILEQNDPVKGAAALGGIGLDVLSGGAGGALLKGGLLKAIARGAGQGALYGGAQGALQPLKDKGAAATAEDIGGNALTGAGTGLLTGGIAGGATNLGGKLFNKLVGQKAGAVAQDTADTTGNTIPKPTIGQSITDKGTEMKARAGGYGVGEKQAGKSLGFFDSAQIDKNLADEGIKAGSPTSRLKAVETALNNKGNQLSSAVDQNNLPISQADKHTIAAQYMNELETTPGVTNTAKKYAQQHVDTFLKSSNDTKGLVDFKRGLDKNAINYNANPDSATSANQLASTVFRNTLKNAINERVPGVQDLNNSFHNLSEAAGFLKSGAKAISDQSQSAGGSLVGRLLTNESAQSAKSRVGAGLQKIGRSITPGDEAPSIMPTNAKGKIDQNALGVAFSKPVLAGTAKQTFGALVNPTVSRNAAIPPPDQPSTDNPNPDLPTSLTDTTAAPSTSSRSDSSNLFNQQNIQNLIMQDLAGNGGKNVNTLLALYKAFGSGQPGASDAGYSKPSASQYSQAVTASQSIDQLEKMLGSSPDLVGKGAIPGQNLPIVGGLESGLLGTSQYKALTQNILNSVARINTGANMPAEEEAFYRSTYLPQPGDSAETQAQKIQNLRSFFSPILNYKGNSGAVDLSALQQ